LGKTLPGLRFGLEGIVTGLVNSVLGKVDCTPSFGGAWFAV
jgi:hypothetical protein